MGYLSEAVAGEGALAGAQRLGDEAARVGFDWDDATGALDKVREEASEVEEALGQGAARVAEELGDLLFAACMVARKAGVDAEGALAAANAKFVRRFEAMAQVLEADGVGVQAASLAQMEDAWQRVKRGPA
jgi:nucleoside triphosphate diphosphatase